MASAKPCFGVTLANRGVVIGATSVPEMLEMARWARMLAGIRSGSAIQFWPSRALTRSCYLAPSQRAPWVAMGSPVECAHKIRAYLEAGANTITLRLTGYDQRHQFKRVTERVLPQQL